MTPEDPPVTLPDGRTGTFTIPAGQAEASRKLSPDQQQAYAAQAAAAISQPPDTSFTGALHYGLAHAARGLGETLKAAGATNWGQSLEDSISTPTNYQPVSLGDVADTVGKAGALTAAGRAVRWLAQQAPDLAGYGAAGLAGGALGGPVGAAAGTMAYSGARTFGDNLDSAASLSGHATPMTDDYLKAGLSSAVEGGLAVLGGKLLRPAGEAAGAAVSGGWRMAGDIGKAVDAMTWQEKLALYEASQEMTDKHDSRSREPGWSARLMRALRAAGVDVGDA